MAGIRGAILMISKQAGEASDPDGLGPGDLTRASAEVGKRKVGKRCSLFRAISRAAHLSGCPSTTIATCTLQPSDLTQLLLREPQHVVDLYVTAGMGDGVIHGGIMPLNRSVARQMSQAESNVRQSVGYAAILCAARQSAGITASAMSWVTAV